MQMVIKIKTPKEFNELAFLVPTAGATSTIPKTMVFVNSLDDGMTLAYHLCNLLSAHIKNDGERIIRTFISVFEPDAKEEYLEDFHNGNTRIWIYTDAARIGVEIRNIVRVVQ